MPEPAAGTAVLGLDPGTRKCGYAVVTSVGRRPVAMGVLGIAELEAQLRTVVAGNPVALAAIGRGTNAAAVAAVVRSMGLPFELVDERETTLRARARFFLDNPPRGWKRLIPAGMLLPDRPIDDYAAVLIAERFLKGS